MDSTKDSVETSPFLSPQNGHGHVNGQPCKIVPINSVNEQRQVYSFNLSTATDIGEGEANNLDIISDSDPQQKEHSINEQPERKKGCRNYIGILLALFAGFVFTSGHIFVKYMKHYHAFTLAMYRLQGIFLPSILMCLYASKVQKINVFEPLWPLRENGKWKTLIKITVNSLLMGVSVTLRASIGCTNLFLVLLALKYLTIADAAVIGSCKPIFVTIAAFFFLGESLGIFPCLMALLTMVGVGIITRPPILTGEEAFDEDTLIGAGFALCSVLTETFVVVMVRSLKHIHVSVMMLALGGWGTIQSTLCAYLVGELKLPETGTDWVYAVILAGVAMLNQLAMNLALQYEQASPVAVTRTMDFTFAFVLQFVILGVIPDLFSVTGASIIIACVLLIACRKWLQTLPATHLARKRYWFVLK